MTESKTKSKANKSLGIDLGTTNSCAAYFDATQLIVIPNPNGERTTSSVVAIDGETRLIGAAALYKMSVDPKKVIFETKRFMGRSFDDPLIKNSRGKWPFSIVKWDKVNNCPVDTNKYNVEDINEVDNIRIAIPRMVDGVEKMHYYDPVEISSYILSHLKDYAEKHLQGEIDNVVITVPAHFNDNQRDKTTVAAKIAGFTNVRLLNEPTAAAMAYGFGRSKSEVNSSSDQTVLVFDFGGGTFDVSLLNFQASTDEGSIAEVEATDGDTFLGGVDIDNVLMDYCTEVWNKKHNTNAVFTEKQKRRLKAAVENAKKTLSSANMATIDLDCFMGEDGFTLSLSRAVYENKCAHIFKKCIERVKGCLLNNGGGNAVYDDNGYLINLTSADNARIEKISKKIDSVILVGGSSRIPKIREMLEQLFGKEKLNYSIHPDEAVALGAAFQAAMLAGNTDLKNENTILLLDTVPLNISIETAGGVSTTMIKGNSTIPQSQTQIFTTYSDNQTGVTIQIHEGNRPLSKDNRLLGSFSLDGIPPAPKGVPQIEVTMEVNNDGILKVSAKDLATSKSQELNVKNTAGRLSEEEIKRMTEEALKFEAADKKALERINARNNLENQIYQSQNIIKDSKIDESTKENYINKIKEIEMWMLSNRDPSIEEINNKENELKEIISSMGAGNAGGFDPSQFGGSAAPPSNQGNGDNGPSVEEVD